MHPLAGEPAPRAALVNVPRLVSAYFAVEPDPAVPAQRVAFGTSGHRGSALTGSFNERHILAIAQAICDHRRAAGIDGPLFVGMDTHALSEPAQISVLEVLAANDVTILADLAGGYTPTPAVSHAIVAHNRGRSRGLADGIVITPSHNPPEDGGIKYNPPHGGPAGSDVTGAIEKAANAMLADLERVRRIPLVRARRVADHFDFVTPYVAALSEAIDLEAVAAAKLRIGVDPLGGSGLAYWAPIAERYGLDLTVVDDTIDPTFAFMPLDRDGRIRMDCSSPWAMARLIGLQDQYDVAFGNDTDFDRHGIVTPSSGLLNPNHYLAVAVDYLFRHRPGWPRRAAVGKTLVSSALIDRVARALDRPVVEVPVGFKWFVPGLSSGAIGFGGEESAGASFLRRDGTTWTTDKDGILLALLAAEITARLGRDPGERYREIAAELGEPSYERIDAPATDAQKAILAGLSPDDVPARELAGAPITAKLTRAPGNGASIGGLKVVTEEGWFAARPSGTEAVYKIYLESFRGADHLARLKEEAVTLVDRVFAAKAPAPG